MGEKDFKAGYRFSWTHGGTARGHVAGGIVFDTTLAGRGARVSEDEPRYVVHGDSGDAVHRPSAPRRESK